MSEEEKPEVPEPLPHPQPTLPVEPIPVTIVEPTGAPVAPPEPATTPLISIPQRVDWNVVIIRVLATLMSSLGLSLSTNATNRQMAAQALLAVATVLFGLSGDMRGRFRRTRRSDSREGAPGAGDYGG